MNALANGTRTLAAPTFGGSLVKFSPRIAGDGARSFAVPIYRQVFAAKR